MNNEQKAAATPTSEPGNRSEGLLPADDADASLEVAEEVSLDLQSDGTRGIGAPPSDTPVSKPAEAMAEALTPTKPSDQDNSSRPQDAQQEPMHEAIDRAVPPSV
jgi:hypothetical protein